MKKKKEHDIHHVASSIKIKEANGMDYKKDLMEGLGIIEDWMHTPEAKDAWNKADKQSIKRAEAYAKKCGTELSWDPHERFHQMVQLCCEKMDQMNNEDTYALFMMTRGVIVKDTYDSLPTKGYFPELISSWPLYTKRGILDQMRFLYQRLLPVMESEDLEKEKAIVKDLYSVTGFAILTDENDNSLTP
jgi:hypothetical protein